jgi:hypothetical protein
VRQRHEHIFRVVKNEIRKERLGLAALGYLGSVGSVGCYVADVAYSVATFDESLGAAVFSALGGHRSLFSAEGDR